MDSISSTSIAETGGLVASGEGAKDTGPRRPIAEEDSDNGDPALATIGGKKLGGDIAPPPATEPDAVPGGLVAEDVAVIGGAPELNSAQRGHLRFVSAGKTGRM